MIIEKFKFIKVRTWCFHKVGWPHIVNEFVVDGPVLRSQENRADIVIFLVKGQSLDRAKSHIPNLKFLPSNQVSVSRRIFMENWHLDKIIKINRIEIYILLELIFRKLVRDLITIVINNFCKFVN